MKSITCLLALMFLSYSCSWGEDCDEEKSCKESAEKDDDKEKDEDKVVYALEIGKITRDADDDKFSFPVSLMKDKKKWKKEAIEVLLTISCDAGTQNVNDDVEVGLKVDTDDRGVANFVHTNTEKQTLDGECELEAETEVDGKEIAGEDTFHFGWKLVVDADKFEWAAKQTVKDTLIATVLYDEKEKACAGDVETVIAKGSTQCPNAPAFSAGVLKDGSVGKYTIAPAAADSFEGCGDITVKCMNDATPPVLVVSSVLKEEK